MIKKLLKRLTGRFDPGENVVLRKYQRFYSNFLGGGVFLEFKSNISIEVIDNMNYGFIINNLKFHNDSGPALELNEVMYSNYFTYFFNIGKVSRKICEIYCKNGVVHRIDGPAIKIYSTRMSTIDVLSILERFVIHSQIQSIDFNMSHIYEHDQWIINGKWNNSYESWARDNGIDLENLAEEDLIFINMKWS